MRIQKLHKWDVTYHEAVAIQNELVTQLRFPPLKKNVSLVAGADISYNRRNPKLFAAIIVMKLPDLEVVEEISAIGMATFPYIPGLLSFRELPMILDLFDKLKNKPDVVLCDGLGIAHPRGIGLASHLGLLLNTPSIGCAKSIYVGEHADLPLTQWSQQPLIYQNKTVGAAVRTRANVKPMYISPGNLIDLESSIKVVKQCTTRYRMPEPTRQAHVLVNALRVTESG